MTSWHKSQEEASRLREVNRAAKALLANHKTKTKTKRENAEEERGGEREGKHRRAPLVVIGSEKPVHCFFVWFFFGSLFLDFLFCCLDLPSSEVSLLMNGFDLTDCLELNLLLFSSRIFSVVVSGVIRVARPPSHPKTWV